MYIHQVLLPNILFFSRRYLLVPVRNDTTNSTLKSFKLWAQKFKNKFKEARQNVRKLKTFSQSVLSQHQAFLLQYMKWICNTSHEYALHSMNL